MLTAHSETFGVFPQRQPRELGHLRRRGHRKRASGELGGLNIIPMRNAPCGRTCGILSMLRCMSCTCPADSFRAPWATAAPCPASAEERRVQVSPGRVTRMTDASNPQPLPPTSEAVLSPVACSSAMTESTALNRSRWLALRVLDILHGVFLRGSASVRRRVALLSACCCCCCCWLCRARFFDGSRSFWPGQSLTRPAHRCRRVYCGRRRTFVTEALSCYAMPSRAPLASR